MDVLKVNGKNGLCSKTLSRIKKSALKGMKGLKKLSPESEVIPLNACATAKYHHAPLPEQEPIKVSITRTNLGKKSALKGMNRRSCLLKR